MTPAVVFRPAAEHELLEAERWFESRHADLGQRFRSAVDATIERIRQFPSPSLRFITTSGARSLPGSHMRCISDSAMAKWSLQRLFMRTAILRCGDPGVEA